MNIKLFIFANINLIKKLMKLKFILVVYICLFATTSYSQVGINTNNPQATLDVNGNVIIRQADLTTFDDIEKVLVLDSNTNEVKAIDKLSITGVEEFKTRITVLLEKSAPQLFPTRGGTNYVIFDGNLSGVQTTKVVLNSDKNQITVPANKVIKITGYLGLLGKNIDGSSTSNPGYIVSEFEKVGSEGTVIFSSKGYVESPGERYDDGGVTFPIILLDTGTTGATIQLRALYGGQDSGATTYYLAGAPSESLVGTYIIIEEL